MWRLLIIVKVSFDEHVQGLIDGGLAAARKMVDEQSGGKARSGGGGGSKYNAEPGGGKVVIELTEANWRKKVGNNEKGILDEFYAPWCGHGSIVQQYGVQGYPTIKYFAPGATEPEDFNGGRTASDIVKFAEEKAAENLTPPEIIQVTSEASVEAGCANQPLCVIAFLSHCDANCRNGHIEDMTKLGDKYKKKDWGWLWSEGMAQPDLEAAGTSTPK